MVAAAVLGPGVAYAADEPVTQTPTTITDPTSADPTTESTDPAPITFDQDAIDALTDQADQADDNKSVFEKAADFVTDNAPWFIIGIIVLAAIIAGILITRGRPRKSGTPRASKSKEAMRNAGGAGEQPSQVPSAAELRRRKRAAVQRSREEERMRRKAGLESRKAARRGEAPIAPVTAAAAGAAAMTAAGAGAGGLDPVEAEKQGARDQATAAGAVARYGALESGGVEEQTLPALPPVTGRTVPAPVSPSQTAPAFGVVTPDAAGHQDQADTVIEPYESQVSEYPASSESIEPDTIYEAAPAIEPEAAPEPLPEAAPEAETSIIHEPSLENPGADAAVGNAAGAFLAGGAAGAAGGFAAARANRPESPTPEPVEPEEPVIAPEPGMSAEHALAESEAVTSEPVEAEPVVAPLEPASTADDQLRAKVAELRATQQPAPAAPVPPEPVTEPEPGPLGPEAELSPGLAAVERRLSENSEERDRTLRDAEERLRRVEQRAEDAERRAAFAERLAQLKVEESEREKRLNQVVSGIDRAEERAREAEARAEAAERAAAAALEQSDLAEIPAPPPAPPEPPARPDSPPPPPEAGPPTPPDPAEPPPRKGLFGGSPSSVSESGSDTINLNSATFEELREAGLSVTQATRILAYRERFGGYNSVEDLEKVPGFPADLIDSLRGRITI